ncbi:CD151 antigen-like [Limulus polyphemus]|uniref:Tetraspanin n=1 Tax=Limulus polyphemus TaxID=6850 RepID=A0ABM1BA30_LIMPO|nr:CD151 antigen-like [Limulus polyphemus]
MVEGCRKLIKYAMLMANLMILVGGIIVFAIGVWTLADKAFMESLLGSNLYVSSAAILIASGVIVIIVAFLGCMGAVKEIKCMLLTYFIILFMIFIMMLVGGILGYVFRNEVDDHMHREMLTTVRQYMNNTPITEAWDLVHKKFECCGMKQEGSSRQPYRIWVDVNPNFKVTGPQVPSSCCKSETVIPLCQKIPTKETAWMKGCYDELKEFVKRHAIIVGGIGVGIACILIVGMSFACALFLMIGR